MMYSIWYNMYICVYIYIYIHTYIHVWGTPATRAPPELRRAQTEKTPVNQDNP